VSAALLTPAETAQIRAVLVKLGRSYLEQKQAAELHDDSTAAEIPAGGDDRVGDRQVQPE
jgi:hypothetical protein